MSTALATQKLVSDLIEDYQAKADSIPDEIAAFKSAINQISSVGSVLGSYGGCIWGRSSPSAPDERTMQKVLRASAWKATYSLLQIPEVATADDKRRFEKMFEDPPGFSMVTVREHFGKYLQNPRFHILRGLAECFCDLDPAYKSHSKVKIGVKGLPKRVILSYWTEYSFNGARDRLRDMINALRAYRGEPLVGPGELHDIVDYWTMRQGVNEFSSTSRYPSGSKVEHEGKFYKHEGVTLPAGPFALPEDGKQGWREIVDLEPGIELRMFPGAQTCHVIFSPRNLLDINRALAEFYGEVLPDAEDDSEDLAPRASRAVVKDLQYYPTPQKVIEEVLSAIDIYRPETYSRPSDRPPFRVLEPSCGDGRILDELVKRRCRVYGIEVDAGRAAESRAKGHAVLCKNFLEVPPEPTFDFVVMNPPFYGRHYVKHVQHALKFLKPGGKLVTILPATAHYDHKETGGSWHDLPVASFAESGTNIPTGYSTISVPSR